MANTKSAIKRIRRISKQTVVNKARKSKYKNALRKMNALIENKEKKTGCSVHFVNENLDGGIIISKKSFFILPSDNENILKIKTQKLEYLAFPEAIIKIFRYC